LAGLFDLSLLFALPTNATVTHPIKEQKKLTWWQNICNSDDMETTSSGKPNIYELSWNRSWKWWCIIPSPYPPILNWHNQILSATRVLTMIMESLSC